MEQPKTMRQVLSTTLLFMISVPHVLWNFDSSLGRQTSCAISRDHISEGAFTMAECSEPYPDRHRHRFGG